MGKSVLITGGTGGVGRAAAALLQADGWHVLAAGRSHDADVKLDVTDPVSIDAARRQIADVVGAAGLDGLVNNAGISVDGPLELVAPERWRQQLEVNVIGQVAVTQAFLPLLRTAGGRIVNVGGAAGRLPLPMYGALSASKAALDALTTALRMELRPDRIDVSYVEPGLLATAFFKRSSQAAQGEEWNGDSTTQSRYADRIEAARQAISEAHATSPEAAARAIRRALRSRRPRPRYVVGRDARAALRVLPLLPHAARERVLVRSVGN